MPVWYGNCLSSTGTILVDGKAAILFCEVTSYLSWIQSHEDQETVPVQSVSRTRVGGRGAWRAAPEIKSLQHPGQRKIKDLA